MFLQYFRFSEDVPQATSLEQPTSVLQNPNNATVVPSAATSSQLSNIDLLSGLDFTISGLTISTPPLQPKSINDNAGALLKSNDEVLTPSKVVPSNNETLTSIQKPKQDLVSSADNLSICSDLSSLDQNFDWESASQKNDPLNQSQVDIDANVTNVKDPVVNPDTVKWFHKEVERLEKTMESVKVKTLNGSTLLDSKWKDLQDLLVGHNHYNHKFSCIQFFQSG